MLNGKLSLKWGVGRYSLVGPLSRGYGISLDEKQLRILNCCGLITVRGYVSVTIWKSYNLIGHSRILEQVQLDVREVARPSFSWRLKGVACETKNRQAQCWTRREASLAGTTWYNVNHCFGDDDLCFFSSALTAGELRLAPHRPCMTLVINNSP